MKFNINKLRSWGLRYLACDESGQLWAYEKPPVRISMSHTTGHWRIADCFLAPEVHFNSSEEEWQRYKDHWAKMTHYNLNGRPICAPISDCPIQISWEDEPYDMVEHGLFPISDLKVFHEREILLWHSKKLIRKSLSFRFSENLLRKWKSRSSRKRQRKM